MNTFSDLFRYLAIYRRYIGRRMYIVFVLSGAAALASGFGITLLLPLLRVSQTGASEDMGTAEQLLYDALAWMGVADSMGGILGFIAVVFVGKGPADLCTGGVSGLSTGAIASGAQGATLRCLQRDGLPALHSRKYRATSSMSSTGR